MLHQMKLLMVEHVDTCLPCEDSMIRGSDRISTRRRGKSPLRHERRSDGGNRTGTVRCSLLQTRECGK